MQGQSWGMEWIKRAVKTNLPLKCVPSYPGGMANYWVNKYGVEIRERPRVLEPLIQAIGMAEKKLGIIKHHS